MTEAKKDFERNNSASLWFMQGANGLACIEGESFAAEVMHLKQFSPRAPYVRLSLRMPKTGQVVVETVLWKSAPDRKTTAVGKLVLNGIRYSVAMFVNDKVEGHRPQIRILFRQKEEVLNAAGKPSASEDCSADAAFAMPDADAPPPVYEEL